MANSYIVDLGINDSMPDIVRKVNDNLKRISKDLTQQRRSDVRQEAKRTDAAIESTRNEIDEAMAEMRKELVDMINNINMDDMRQELTNLINSKSIPPVGTYIYATYDPNAYWPGTTWERVSQGNFLIAAGDSYKTGSTYGSNTVTLTESQIPSHTHEYRLMMANGTSTNYVTPVQKTGNDITYLSNMNNRDSEATGGGQAHNNIPQSIATPLWHRTK